MLTDKLVVGLSDCIKEFYSTIRKLEKSLNDKEEELKDLRALAETYSKEYKSGQ